MKWLDARTDQPTNQVLVSGLLCFGCLSLFVEDYCAEVPALSWMSGDCDIVAQVKDHPFYQSVAEIERILSETL